MYPLIDDAIGHFVIYYPLPIEIIPSYFFAMAERILYLLPRSREGRFFIGFMAFGSPFLDLLRRILQAHF